MFENLRQSLKDLADGTIPASERASVLASMRSILVQARAGVADLSAAVEKTRAKLAEEQSELETIRRRKSMAAQIGDAETVRVAGQFEEKHAGRLDLLQRKLTVQEDELRMADAEVTAMTADLKSASLGVGSGPGTRSAEKEADEILNEARDLQRDIDAIARQRNRASREAEAEEKLADLKRRMQK